MDALAGALRDRSGSVPVNAGRYENRTLYTALAIGSFFAAAGVGVFTSFLIGDWVLWTGISKQVAFLLVSLSWVLIFPVWAVTFLFILSVLDAVGIRDARAVAG